MNAVLFELFAALLGAFRMLLIYRFLSKALIKKYSSFVTCLIMMAFWFVLDRINIHFYLAEGLLANELYFHLAELIPCIFLFRGAFLKKIFFAAFLAASYTGISSTTLILLSFFPVENQLVWQMAYLSALYITMAIWGVMIELLSRHFSGLKQGLSTRFIAFILLVTVFVFTVMLTFKKYSWLVVGQASMLYTIAFLIFLSLGGTMLIVFAIFTMDRELSHRLSEQSTLMQLENLKEKEDYWQRLASFRHDIKNHMSCLESLMKGGKNEQALSYLDTLTDTIKQLDNRISTGNEFADAIINEKMAVMAEKNIVFTEDISLPEKCRLEPVELCCIFSNTLDNATQACEQIDGERWIKAQAFIRQSQLIIIIENSIEVPNKSKALTPFPHAERGIGLLNVRTVVEKHGGAMEVSRDKTFVFSAMLPMD